MFKLGFIGIVCLSGIALALPSKPILRKLDPLRFQHARDDSTGQYHLIDMWMTADHIAEAARYNPEESNVYHLFTRLNPTVSQPLVIGNLNWLASSNISGARRTIVLIHGWRDSATSELNTVLVPALLAAEDLNVVVVDWSVGASTINYPVALDNAIASGVAVEQFFDWVNFYLRGSPVQYHIIGHGLGGHQAGVVARRMPRLGESVPYVTGLDPSLVGWINHPDRFNPDDGVYTEVIHTNAGINGYLADLAKVDFYPNGGESMPGCDSHSCDHLRSIFYFAESITSGGFTGRRCANYLTAVLQVCTLPGTLQMGGLRPKFGSEGVYFLRTNAAPPFSQG
ncbi:inactive pancreatic lipase-related protein 1-like [Pectinophora gossypiella]|uniref:inactive pancreatic lipase-related protein 1-like n=1 Tax=Pectinophora gossypiella TaxID=13191 RepID=UPI00214F29BB|nr:inactive pancreatic lipase-related protein 1-like [Pectinophora gossypiella]